MIALRFMTLFLKVHAENRSPLEIRFIGDAGDLDHRRGSYKIPIMTK
jgi:hypothetical protein